MAALLTTLVAAIAVKLVQRVRRGLRGGTSSGGGDGGSWRERLPFGRRSYAVRSTEASTLHNRWRPHSLIVQIHRC